MYGNPSPFTSRTQRASAMYSKVGVETNVFSASPHRLVGLLFEGAVEAMRQGIGAIEADNTELKSRALGRAVRILDEGLKAALNLEAGKLSTDLRDLYAYVCMRLTQANLHRDVSAIEECLGLLQPVQDAWNAIGETQEPLKKQA